MNAIKLSDHFDYKRLLRYCLPSIIMMLFTSIYYIVDGFFVSNFAGKTPFAAVNLIMPLLLVLGCVGFMFGTGGGALISKTMGERRSDKANEIFTLIIVVSTACGVVLAALGFFLLRPVARLMGAEGELLEQSIIYGRIILLALPFYILQFEFQCLFSTAEKPKLGLYVTVASGVANMIPLVYFSRENTSRLRLVKFKFDGRALLKTCGNGSSEFMSNVSMSIVSMLYNVQLMKYAGEDGVAAYGVLMYVSMIFQAIFIGYAVGTAPIIGFNYGAQNREELKGLLSRSLRIISVCAVCMFAAGQLLAEPLGRLFVGYDDKLLDMTVHAFGIFSFAFLFSGFSIFGSSFFTALNDGLTSALISFLRTLVFQLAAVMLFPLIWELDGIWLSIVGAEVMSIIATALFLIGKRKRYGY